MSEFDDNFFDVTGTDSTSSYPVFKELAINFETGEYLTENDNYIYVEKDEALKVWIWKALKTERNKYLYSDSFGNELHEEIGQVYDRTVKQQLIFNEIQECLIVNPYIKRVYNFSADYSDENGTLKVTFSVETLYNVIEEVQEIYV